LLIQLLALATATEHQILPDDNSITESEVEIQAAGQENMDESSDIEEKEEKIDYPIQKAGEIESAYKKRIDDYWGQYNLESEEINDVCNKTQMERDEMVAINKYLYEQFSSLCQQHEERLLKIEMESLMWINETFIVGLVIALLLTLIWVVGFTRILIRIFYYVSFHWLLKYIISVRNGGSFRANFATSVSDFVDNDEEMANAIIDTSNDFDDGPKGTQNTSQVKKQKAKRKIKKRQQT